MNEESGMERSSWGKRVWPSRHLFWNELLRCLDYEDALPDLGVPQEDIGEEIRRDESAEAAF